MARVIIIIGSKVDFEYASKIKEHLNFFGVESIIRVGSAHKTPLKVLEIIKEYESEKVVFITVAGKSNALSGFVDANTSKPVIASPPYSEKFAGFDVFSTLRMPSGVAPLTVLEPEQAAIAAVKILSLVEKNLEDKIREFQEKKRKEIDKHDIEISGDHLR
jgi:5-(carboxyamino)imidazole ribonucleotide mutase